MSTKNTNSPLVTILNTSILHDIQIAQSKLASEGIDSYFFDENLNSIIGTSMVEGYRLEVAENDAEKAAKILQSFLN